MVGPTIWRLDWSALFLEAWSGVENRDHFREPVRVTFFVRPPNFKAEGHLAGVAPLALVLS